jgi:hypothetical protein
MLDEAAHHFWNELSTFEWQLVIRFLFDITEKIEIKTFKIAELCTEEKSSFSQMIWNMLACPGMEQISISNTASATPNSLLNRSSSM